MVWNEQEMCGHLILAFHFRLISTQQNCLGARDLRKQTHSKTKACVPFSPQPNTQGRNWILNWSNLLRQSLWNGPLQLYLSTLTATLWLDGLNASRLQHRYSSPTVTLLGIMLLYTALAFHIYGKQGWELPYLSHCICMPPEERGTPILV